MVGGNPADSPAGMLIRSACAGGSPLAVVGSQRTTKSTGFGRSRGARASLIFGACAAEAVAAGAGAERCQKLVRVACWAAERAAEAVLDPASMEPHNDG